MRKNQILPVAMTVVIDVQMCQNHVSTISLTPRALIKYSHNSGRNLPLFGFLFVFFLLLGFCGLHVSSVKMKCMSSGLEVGGFLSFTEHEYGIWITVLMVEAKLPESVPGLVVYQDSSSCRARFIHKVEILAESIP